MTLGLKAKYWPTNNIPAEFSICEFGICMDAPDEPGEIVWVAKKPLAISTVHPIDNGNDWEATLYIESASGVRTSTHVRFSEAIYPDGDFVPRLRWNGAEIPFGMESLAQRYLVASIAKAIKAKRHAEQPERIVEAVRRYVLGNYADIPGCSLDGAEDKNPVNSLPVIVEGDVLLLSESGLVAAAGEGTPLEIVHALVQAGVIFENSNELNRCFAFDDQGTMVTCHAIFLRALLSVTGRPS